MRATSGADDWAVSARAAMLRGATLAGALVVLLVLLGLTFGEWAVRITAAAVLLACVGSGVRLWLAGHRLEHDMGVQLESVKRDRRAEQT